MSHRRAAGTPPNVLDTGWEGGANFVSQLIKLKNYLNICIEDSKKSILPRSVPVGKFSFVQLGPSPKPRLWTKAEH